MNKTLLIQQLQQQVQQLYSQDPQQSSQKVYTKFDRSLFSEDFQTIGFYLKEIEQTLTEIQHLDDIQTEACAFLCEKLYAQCQALKRHTEPKKVSKPKANINLIKSPVEAKKHAIHQLPPKQRLQKYYEALQALNDKITQQQNASINATDEQQKMQWQSQIEHTQQRKKRCLEAIELLEEYLAFAEGGLGDKNADIF